jgi:hypothetical protein
MADIIDINVSQINETVTINTTPNLTTININTISGGGGAVSSVNGEIGDVIIPVSDNNFTNALKTKLDGIATGAEVNVNADWNATSGDAQILNKPTIPAAQVNSDWNSVSGVSQILNKPTIPGAQEQSNWDETDSDKPTFIRNKPVVPTQTSDLINNGNGGAGEYFLTEANITPQVNSDWNATSGKAEILNKPTIPTQTSQLTNNGSDGVNPFITALDIPTTGQASTLVREVKNMTGATLTKGTVVYISGANGNKALVSKALATTDALSSRTFGLLQSNILNNGLGNCVIIGDLSGLNTSSFTEGAQLYLSGVTAGTYTETKILAPTHLVYVGKVTRVHPTQGQIEVGIQNGYELAEIHDVALSSVANNQLLSFDSSTSLWKNKSVTTADIADSTNKRYQTDNQQTFNDATSSIQTQINAKQNSLGYSPFRYFNPTQSAPSLTTGEKEMIRITIPANSFSANDKFKFRILMSKVGVTLATTVRIKLTTSTSMPSGSTQQIATFALGAANTYAPIERSMGIIGGNLKGFPFTTSIVQDNGFSTATLSQVAFDVTQTQYLYVSVTPTAVTTDLTYLEIAELTN